MTEEQKDTKYTISVLGSNIQFYSPEGKEYINEVEKRIHLLEKTLPLDQSASTSSNARKMILATVYDLLETEKKHKLRLRTVIQKLDEAI